MIGMYANPFVSPIGCCSSSHSCVRNTVTGHSNADSMTPVAWHGVAQV